MSVVWNAANARYRDTETGRFISRSTLESYLYKSQVASEEAVTELVTSVKKMSSFSASFRLEIKDEYIRQYIAGRGGISSMEPSDWGRIGRALRDQYQFAERFFSDIPDMSEAAVINRATLYVRSAGQAFEMGQRQACIKSDKFTEEYWQLGDTEHCSDCEQLNSMGWVAIGTLPTVPRAGATACLVNCECGIRYR